MPLEVGDLMLMVYTLTVVYMPLEVVDRAVLWSTVSTVDLAHKLIHPSAEKLKLTCGREGKLMSGDGCTALMLSSAY
jgi:hypothetical protein